MLLRHEAEVPPDDEATEPPAAPAKDGVVFPPFPKMQVVYDGYFRTRVTRKSAEELMAEHKRDNL